MRSEVLIIASRDRSPRIECRGGIAGRLSSADTVHLVSTAATPLGGDVIEMRIVVEPGARLLVRSVAATVALPGRHTPTSHSVWSCDVGGVLDVDLEPTVVAGTSRHISSVTVNVGEGGGVRWRERVQIGRSDERDGFWSGTMRADIDGSPLLRHRVELGVGSLTADQLETPLATVSELRYPETTFATLGTLLELAAGGCLATWQGQRLSLHAR